jgi:hypothetical protein
MRNPKQTIAYLEELQTLGLTNEGFSRLHHFRAKGKKETVQGHTSYCEKTDSFQEDHNNERVQVRLEMILRCFKEYHQRTVASGDVGELFVTLADASYALVPPTEPEP